MHCFAKRLLGYLLDVFYFVLKSNSHASSTKNRLQSARQTECQCVRDREIQLLM